MGFAPNAAVSLSPADTASLLRGTTPACAGTSTKALVATERVPQTFQPFTRSCCTATGSNIARGGFVFEEGGYFEGGYEGGSFGDDWAGA